MLDAFRNPLDITSIEGKDMKSGLLRSRFFWYVRDYITLTSPPPPTHPIATIRDYLSYHVYPLLRLQSCRTSVR